MNIKEMMTLFLFRKMIEGPVGSNFVGSWSHMQYQACVSYWGVGLKSNHKAAGSSQYNLCHYGTCVFISMVENVSDHQVQGG